MAGGEELSATIRFRRARLKGLLAQLKLSADDWHVVRKLQDAITSDLDKLADLDDDERALAVEELNGT